MPEQEFTEYVSAPYGRGEAIAVEPGVKHRRQVANGDISGGVTTSTADIPGFSVYISTAGAVDITVEMSPDGGTTWFELPSSPESYGSATEDILFIEYEGDEIRFTGSNTTSCNIHIYGI